MWGRSKAPFMAATFEQSELLLYLLIQPKLIDRNQGSANMATSRLLSPPSIHAQPKRNRNTAPNQKQTF